MHSALRNYLVITGGYWGFTITDGAMRMLIVLYFHLLGYSPLQLAMLFLFYEFFGVVTNLLGGWLGARFGLNRTMNIGMCMQVIALSMLAVPAAWLSVAYVMVAQALSGIAKDLNKMSAKSSIKVVLPQASTESRLFRWVAVLTGSKNALKGAGFFVGAGLLEWLGFRQALLVLAGALAVVFVLTLTLLPKELGKACAKPKFKQLFSKAPQVNRLSAARFFLFAARDVWFVVALPVFLYATLGWSFTQVGSFMALWIIAYGMVQALAPSFIARSHHVAGPDGASALLWVLVLMLVPAVLAYLLQQQFAAERVIVVGLFVFGALFAVNSAIHSYLIVSWSDRDQVAMNVGFYYMANAGGRLLGTVLSGWVFQRYGFEACMYLSSALLCAAALVSTRLPRNH
jgi:predicted MFS family arabinose efflux permease